MDAIGVGVIDFKSQKFEAIQANMHDDQIYFSDEPTLYFDLASLTKPLTNSLSYFLKKDEFDSEMLLCLNHRAGLPAWGLLPRKGWKEQILSYKITQSETLYSDFSALRVMLELAKKDIDQKKICQTVWDEQTLNWLDLPNGKLTPQCGFKGAFPNFGEVHDPNAWVVHDFCSHAGLFSTIHGLCKTLINYQEKTDFLFQVKANIESHNNRYALGWDRVLNPMDTLAGVGCGPKSFGHLGFTGTSVWIDPEKMRGHVILSNTVKYHWFNKVNLNDIRRSIGEIVWR